MKYMFFKVNFMSDSSRCQIMEHLTRSFPGYCTFFPLVQVFFSANMHLRDMFFNITLPRIPSPSEVINNWPLISSSAKKSCTSDPMLTSLVMD